MAAAMLIVSEAGGITADPADGSPLNFTSGRVSASNSRELLQLFLQCVNDSCSASSGSNASRL
jgi:fructose-1,6-bisphosphatase/inositol monophosphatase family enzyme